LREVNIIQYRESQQKKPITELVLIWWTPSKLIAHSRYACDATELSVIIITCIILYAWPHPTFKFKWSTLKWIFCLFKYFVSTESVWCYKAGKNHKKLSSCHVYLCTQYDVMTLCSTSYNIVGFKHYLCMLSYPFSFVQNNQSSPLNSCINFTTLY